MSPYEVGYAVATNSTNITLKRFCTAAESFIFLDQV